MKKKQSPTTNFRHAQKALRFSCADDDDDDSGGGDDDDCATLPQGVWKVLVYDKYCQDMLAPLINVSELRKMGITLHMLIGQRRYIPVECNYSSS